MSTGAGGSAFADVDAHGAAARLSSYLDQVAVVVADLKQRSLDLLELGPGRQVLDIGCGMGEEVSRLAERVAPGGRAVGLDYSAEFVAMGQQRGRGGAGGEFVHGDAHDLPFPADTFDAVRTERTLQHLEDPRAALAEMRRVARPGAPVLAAEPDWGTLSIAGAPPEAARAVADAVAHGIRNPNVGRDLLDMFAGAGFSDTRIFCDVVPVRSLETATTFFALSEENLRTTLGAELAATWAADLERRDRAGTFVALLSGVCVVGRA